MSTFRRVVAAAIATLLFVAAYAAEPVGITAIDARNGLVTLRETTTGKVTVVKVSNLTALKDLKVGQQVALEGNHTLKIRGTRSIDVTVEPAEPVGARIRGQ